MFAVNTWIVALALAAGAADAPTDAVSDQPKDVPLTREQVKEAIDKVKYRKPRFPRREGAEGNRGRGERREGGERRDGERREGERRGGRGGGGLGRNDDPAMTLEYPFATEMFWIVSRVNNCHYCLGHQENKLLAAGLTDDQIAALDGDWTQFTPKEQAAFAFARKLTYEPHLIEGTDIAQLREHFTELQTLEIVYYVSRYNSMNRRTDGMGLVQQENRVFKTPTSDKYSSFVTTIAPINKSVPQGTLAPAVMAVRPELEPRAEVLARLVAARNRQARFSLVDEAKARELVAEWPAGNLPNYVRLLANFPKTGISAAEGQRRSEENGELSPLMRARIAWISARNDRAWYALGRAYSRLKSLGASDDEIFALDAPTESQFTPGELAAFRLTRKITTAPQLITDADVESVKETLGEREAAEVISRNTQAALFNRLTEAANLPLEE